MTMPEHIPLIDLCDEARKLLETSPLEHPQSMEKARDFIASVIEKERSPTINAQQMRTKLDLGQKLLNHLYDKETTAPAEIEGLEAALNALQSATDQHFGPATEVETESVFLDTPHKLDSVMRGGRRSPVSTSTISRAGLPEPDIHDLSRTAMYEHFPAKLRPTIDAMFKHMDTAAIAQRGEKAVETTWNGLTLQCVLACAMQSNPATYLKKESFDQEAKPYLDALAKTLPTTPAKSEAKSTDTAGKTREKHGWRAHCKSISEAADGAVGIVHFNRMRDRLNQALLKAKEKNAPTDEWGFCRVDMQGHSILAKRMEGKQQRLYIHDDSMDEFNRWREAERNARRAESHAAGHFGGRSKSSGHGR